ncbi:MBL fold metallo-hydrolase [Gordonia sp. (in: high G+C Gram-positive bacteria)]|uniref:MBL fold metallo-hydrolase n=1 Tax=Gordonia sp. (in: high G+C Gram-positive bacteria) TaxID=84139 RepID=UPI003C749376
MRALGANREQIAPMTASSDFARDGVFANLDPAPDIEGPDMGIAMDMLRHPGKPNAPIPVLRPTFPATPDGMSVTWLGHASAVVDLDGVRMVTDPVLSQRCSPSQFIGPKRLHRAPLTAAELPHLDVVLISHDHYDHLDTPTVIAIARAQPEAIFVVPIGVGAHLQAWGVAPDRIRQADWYEQVDLTVRGTTIRFHAAPARHFSGRSVARNLTQWVSWSVIGPHHRFFFSGDTGMTQSYVQTGRDFGPFDVTLIAIGAYDPSWPDIHLTPEEAVAIHQMLNGAPGPGILLPIHWGTFNLARHSWADPMVRLTTEAQRLGFDVCAPRPGATLVAENRTGTAFFDATWWERCA